MDHEMIACNNDLQTTVVLLETSLLYQVGRCAILMISRTGAYAHNATIHIRRAMVYYGIRGDGSHGRTSIAGTADTARYDDAHEHHRRSAHVNVKTSDRWMSGYEGVHATEAVSRMTLLLFARTPFCHTCAYNHQNSRCSVYCRLTLFLSRH